MDKCVSLLCALLIVSIAPTFSQLPAKAIPRCATDIRLQQKLQHDPAQRSRFNAERLRFAAAVEDFKQRKASLRIGPAAYTIPIVFHIVLQNPNSITDAQILEQLSVLNECFAAENDQTELLAGFRDRIGTTGIAFCLAQRTPGNLPSSGINRYTTSHAQFDPNSNDMKRSSRGGADAWDPNRFMNVWVTNLSNGIVGFATFPGVDDPLYQGVVISPIALPESSNPQFNEGKTLVHESGHFFNLYHIWGDDDGACSGSDDVDDTPNQANSTNGSRDGIQTDNCSTTAPGFMYQNFMDYTDDIDLLTFTADQVTRMETALTDARLILSQSNGCAPVNLPGLDGELSYLVDFSKRICEPTVGPNLVLHNRGSQTINSALIRVTVAGSDSVDVNYTGAITSLSTATISIPALVVPEGISNLRLQLVSVNGSPDNDVTNNELQQTIQYHPPQAIPYLESFEGDAFPPFAWDTLNPDNGIGWEQYNGAGYTGTSSVRMRNIDYNQIGQIDWLRMPQFNLGGIDSAFLNFQVAAATYSPVTAPDNNWDTLEVMISRDCGASYTSLYKKWGASLVTVNSPVTQPFVPTVTQWRKDSIDISSYIGTGEILIGFRHVAGFENNVYLDDVSIRPVTVMANLKQKGVLLYPNPTAGAAKLQFYPQPSGLKALVLYDIRGAVLQKWEIPSGNASNSYNIDVSRHAAGVYILRAFFNDRVVAQKLVKQ